MEIGKPLHMNNFLLHIPFAFSCFLQGSTIFHCFLKMEEGGLKGFCRVLF